MKHPWLLLVPVTICIGLLYYSIYMMHDPAIYVSNSITQKNKDIESPVIPLPDSYNTAYGSMAYNYDDMMVNVGTYTTGDVTMRYDRISFCDASGRQVVLIHLDTGDIVHSYDGLDKAGQEAADIFWGAFGARLKQKM